MDDADLADARIQSVVDEGIQKSRNTPTMQPIGRCYYCDDDIAPHMIFCSSDCSLDHLYLQQRKKASGT